MAKKLLPKEALFAEIDVIQYEGDRCCYDQCTKKPIQSHTIAKNNLSKLNSDLRKVLTFSRSLVGVFDDQKQKIIPVNSRKFSTFVGFCEDHDCDLFKEIDEFDGSMNKKKAVFIHYRIICYGINHIKTKQLQVEYLAQQNYREGASYDSDVENAYRMLKNGAYMRRLVFCLNEYEIRKRKLEAMIKDGRYDGLNYNDELRGGLEDPIFFGRSSVFLHPKHNFFKTPGYCFMPWITFMTLRTDYENQLVFFWLKQDEAHIQYFKKLLKKESESVRKVIASLAYGSSDAFAIDQSFYDQHDAIIKEINKECRVY